MIRVEAIENFDYGDFDKLVNLKRLKVDKYGSIYKGDTFECTKDIAEYLLGNNRVNKAVVKVIEVIPKK